MEIFILLLIFSFSFSESFKTFQNSKYSYRILDEEITYMPEPEGIKILKEPKATKPTLVDFGGFQRKDSREGLNIEFTLYFKNVASSIRQSIFLGYIYFRANITKREKTERLLEDSKENENPLNTLLMGVLDSDTLSEDIVKYKVNNIIVGIENKDFKSLEIIPNFQIVNSMNINESLIREEIDSGSSDIEIRSSLNTKNVENYTAESEYNPLYFKINDINHLGYLYYKVIGFFKETLSLDILDKKELTFHYDQFGEDKTFQGIFEKTSDSNNYTLTFRLKDFIIADLGRDCWANITDYKIKKARRLQEDNIYKEINLFPETLNILNLEESEPEFSYFAKKVKSSSGLSGGAIAGIVICCVVALVALTFAIIYFNKSPNKTTGTNAIEFYNNNKSNVNSSVEIVQ